MSADGPKLRHFHDGSYTSIYWMDYGQDRDLLRFIDGLEDEKVQQRAVALLELAAERPITDERKCRKLEKGLFEFKTRDGVRLMWFWHKAKDKRPPDLPRLTGITHGFIKKTQKTPRAEIDLGLARKAVGENLDPERD